MISDQEQPESIATESSPPTLPVTPTPIPELVPSRPERLDRRNFVGCSSIDDYVFDRKLGEGTFGEVHKGRHLKTSRVVALKRIIMHAEKEGIPITAIREIKILKALSHPNVLSLIDMIFVKGEQFGPKRASIYMVTPYMDHDLCGLIENPSVIFSLSQIKCYMKQLLEGMFYLHSNNVLHRDIKTANLLINNDGILKIADFGLARPIESPDAEYTNCVVTRWYRPPELLLGQKNYTSSIDMWGVGCVFAQMLQSKPLLPGKNDIEQLDLIFQLCGSPTSENFPGFEDLPGCDGVSFTYYSRRILEHFSGYDQYAIDLIDQLLVLNPKRRLTANDALSHYFFYMDPLPALPSSLPKYESSHEYDRRVKDEVKDSRSMVQSKNFSTEKDRSKNFGIGGLKVPNEKFYREHGFNRQRQLLANSGIRRMSASQGNSHDRFSYSRVGSRNIGSSVWFRDQDDGPRGDNDGGSSPNNDCT